MTAMIAGTSAVTLAAMGWAGASVALASPTTYTLSGSGGNGGPFSPDSNTIDASVDASLTRHVAAGSLETSGRPGGGPEGTVYVFNGSVTCMLVEKRGERVIVGAFGTVEVEPPLFEKRHKLPGKYAQVLTVEFGEFTDPEEPTRLLTDSFGVLGTHEEGLKSTEPPTCRGAKFTHQILPTGSGVFELMLTKV